MHGKIVLTSSSDAVALNGSVYGAGNGSILVDYFRCNGNELQLMDCSHKPPQPYQCSSKNVASVLCRCESQAPFRYYMYMCVQVCDRPLYYNAKSYSLSTVKSIGLCTNFLQTLSWLYLCNSWFVRTRNTVARMWLKGGKIPLVLVLISVTTGCLWLAHL